MYTKLTPTFINLVYEATLKSFWRHEATKRFLRNCSVPDSLIAPWGHEESKRSFLDRLFEELPKLPNAEEIFAKMGMSLVEQTSFPDLMNWEDTEEKLEQARTAVNSLRIYTAEQDKQISDEKSAAEAREKFHENQVKMRRSQQDLENLSTELTNLVTEIGTADGGYKFEKWFFDLTEYFDIISRRPYTHDGRQIDGSVTILDTTYLVELKFTATPVGSPDIDIFLRKVTTKADNTMGILVSMSGYTDGAIKDASGDKTPLVLLDYRHVYHVLGFKTTLQDLVLRIRRHSSQTGEAYLSLDRFGEG
jgi:hypothetical protein